MLPFSKLLKISRPLFWGYTAGPYFLGAIIAAPSLVNLVQPLVVMHWLYFLVPVNLLIYGVNDFFDQDTDQFNPKKAGPEGRVDKGENRQLLPWLVAMFSLSALLLLVQPDLSAAGLFALFLFLSLGYSLPPLRFKARPILDSLSNSLYFLPGFLAYYHTSGSLPEVGWWGAALAWTTAMHLYSAVPDIKYDRMAGIKTSATELGEQPSLIVCSLLWAVFSGLVWWLVGFNLVSVLVIAYPLLPLLSLLKRDLPVTKVYWWFPKITLLLGTFATWWVMNGRGWWY